MSKTPDLSTIKIATHVERVEQFLRVAPHGGTAATLATAEMLDEIHTMLRALTDKYVRTSAPASPAVDECFPDIVKLIENYFAPWGSWKTAWWESVSDQDFSAETLLRVIFKKITGRDDPTAGKQHEKGGV